MNKYSDIEIQTAKRLRDAGYKWLARTIVGNVVAFSYKPYKSEGFWLCPSNSACINGKVAFTSGKITPIFQSIKWEDKEPTYIEDIIKQQILDDTEKRYLASVIKPFRDRAIFVKKTYRNGFNNVAYEQIFIRVKSIATDIADIPFPFFKKGEMYKGMKLEREYTLEELGL